MKRGLGMVFGIVGILLVVSVFVVRRWRDADRPNIILISVDTLRADHLGSYGHTRPTSPVLDQLAAEGVRFAHAYSQASWTLPSHMSVMTSQYPHVHGVQNDGVKLAESATTLAEALRGEGYETAAFVSWVYVSRAFGFGQGFHDFTPLIERSKLQLGPGGGSFPAARVTDSVLPWLDRPHPDPFFLFVHYFDPHMNYSPPDAYADLFDPDYVGNASGDYRWIKPYIARLNQEPASIAARDRQHVEALYDAEIRYVDHEIGRLLAAVDARVGLENCVVVLMSDHGEEFDDHGSMEGHGWTLYDEILHVPLIVRFGSGRHAGLVVDQPVELIDIAPTVLDAAGVPAPAFFQGRSLIPLIEGRPAEGSRDAPRFVFAEMTRFNIERQSVRGPHFKLVHTEDTGTNEFGFPVQAGFELFRVDTDPREQENVYDREPTVARRLGTILLEQLAAQPEAMTTPGKARISEQDKRLLESLGYVR